jgi:hypothetical protein
MYFIILKKSLAFPVKSLEWKVHEQTPLTGKRFKKHFWTFWDLHTSLKNLLLTFLWLNKTQVLACCLHYQPVRIYFVSNWQQKANHPSNSFNNLRIRLVKFITKLPASWKIAY